MGLCTYFASVLIEQADDDLRDLPPVLWIGTSEHEIRNPAALVEPLRPYADLDQVMLDQLAADKAAAPERTALQRWGASLGKGWQR
ncbi:hypothetical protein JL101_035710 (plasmid) [Skermanella rosea]|uniref:hypothetical protein n=1 Tax=Skermanella rosea TaxID=1817965 RepID=UPI0019338450|nr:hypothetical protein [Skermanella rosea]UEM07999.1 hypothetical protein JL101_035710 [Skermanella rosea]